MSSSPKGVQHPAVCPTGGGEEGGQTGSLGLGFPPPPGGLDHQHAESVMAFSSTLLPKESASLIVTE